MYHYEQYTPTPISASASTSNLHGVGETRNERYTRFQLNMPRIESNPRYVIDRNGTVYTFADPVQEIKPMTPDTILLDGRMYNIDDLLLRHYVGNLPLPVIPRSKKPSTNIYVGRRCSKLTYYVKSIRASASDPSVIYINTKIRFKRVP